MDMIEKSRLAAPIVVRLGLSLVFIWFSISQFSDPSSWISYLPSWTAALPVSQITLVFLNATLEIIFGILLLLGIFTRISATILALHMISIMIAVGYNEIGVRDFGLMLATASVALHGADKWCIAKGRL